MQSCWLQDPKMPQSFSSILQVTIKLLDSVKCQVLCQVWTGLQTGKIYSWVALLGRLWNWLVQVDSVSATRDNIEGPSEEEGKDGESNEPGEAAALEGHEDKRKGEEPARKSFEVQGEGGAPAGSTEGHDINAVEGEIQPPPEEVRPLVEELEKEDEPGMHFPVRALIYAAGNLGTFYVAFEGKPAGYVFECHIYSEQVLGFTQWLDCPLKCLRYTHSSRYLISGSDDGMVRVQESPTPGQLQLAANESKYWEGGVHDGFYGAVGGVVTSFDDRYLASVSSDGSFFVHALDMTMGTEITKHSVQSMVAKKAQLGESEEVDILADALSIEEQRAKTKHDEKLRLALEKKRVVLEKVASIQTRLAALVKEMHQHDRNEKLPLSDFEIDPHVRMYKTTLFDSSLS